VAVPDRVSNRALAGHAVMVGRTKPIGKADSARFAALQHLGCICCWLEGHPHIPAEIHHKTTAGRRDGHQETLPLCPWHHRAVPPFGVSVQSAREWLGPSLAEGKATFVGRYGTEEELLRRVNALIEHPYGG